MRKWWLARSILTVFRWCSLMIRHERRIAASFVMKLKKDRERYNRTWSLMWSMIFVGGPDAMGSEQWCSSSAWSGGFWLFPYPKRVGPEETSSGAFGGEHVSEHWAASCWRSEQNCSVSKSDEIHLWSFHYCALRVNKSWLKNEKMCSTIMLVTVVGWAKSKIGFPTPELRLPCRVRV